MIDEPFEDVLREAAEDYHRPPEVPRHEMWQRLQHARAARQQPPQPRRRGFYPLLWASGIAAGILVGIGLGQLSIMRRLAPSPAAVAELSDARPNDAPSADTATAAAGALGNDDGSRAIASVTRPVNVTKRPKHPKATRRSTAGEATVPAAYKVTMMEHLGQAEVFLTLFRLSAQRGEKNRLSSMTARQLLATNRLLLDSPIRADTARRALLQDLELVLVRIALLSPASEADDLKRITKVIEQDDVMKRVRNGVPAGFRPVSGRGAL